MVFGNMREMIGIIDVAKSIVEKLPCKAAALDEKPGRELLEVEGPGSCCPMKLPTCISYEEKARLLEFTDNSS
jgi:hypothetical protein